MALGTFRNKPMETGSNIFLGIKTDPTFCIEIQDWYGE